MRVQEYLKMLTCKPALRNRHEIGVANDIQA